MQCRYIIATADAQAIDEDVWYGLSFRHLCQQCLQLRPDAVSVQFNNVWGWRYLVKVKEDVLGLFGVRAVGFRKYDDWIKLADVAGDVLLIVVTNSDSSSVLCSAPAQPRAPLL